MFDKMNDLRKQDHYTDLKIKTFDGSIDCHKYILCEASEYYKGLFRSGMRETENHEINFDDIETENLEAVISFIYTGKADITNSNAVEILQYGHMLQLIKLVQLCAKVMLKNVTIETCLHYKRISEIYELSELKKISTRFLLLNTDSVIGTDDFMNLEPKDMIELLGDRRLTINNEANLYASAKAWVKRDESIRSKHMDLILQLTRPKESNSEEVTNLLRKTSLSNVHRKVRSKTLQPSTFSDLTSRKGLIQTHLVIPTIIKGMCLYYLDGDDQWRSFDSQEEIQTNCICNYASGDEVFVQMGGALGRDETVRKRKIDTFGPNNTLLYN